MLQHCSVFSFCTSVDGDNSDKDPDYNPEGCVQREESLEFQPTPVRAGKPTVQKVKALRPARNLGAQSSSKPPAKTVPPIVSIPVQVVCPFKPHNGRPCAKLFSSQRGNLLMTLSLLHVSEVNVFLFEHCSTLSLHSTFFECFNTVQCFPFAPL